MKKNKLLNRLLLTLALPIVIMSSCDDEDGAAGYSTDFAAIGSSYYEADGTGIVTIAFRNANPSFVEGVEFELGGTAVEGEDYEFIGVTAEGVQLRILDDNKFEPNETIRVQMSSTGNNIHIVTIASNCEDTEDPYLEYFQGDWNATEFYCGLGVTTGSCDYGPYVIHLLQDSEDPTRFTFDNLYDSGCDAYMIFDVAEGTVYFPNQAPCDSDLTNSSGTFTIDECNDATTLTINLNFDGGDWIYYFQKL
ncbi:hypothetical protein SanaruYs_24740 [Chryseotalea sanaruensis]|uniref:Lipocalin-like domain-containing protein n=1 Tax=Chryseotalea sanaruensis TaxID=2482724 RepID=A0A401UBE8_9BACT|nr:hypothetical protein [Chryseotalea sanaruensis]GCC52238.1 hypothetical protein SanaruYs_24740 [Chryseotalea sanaruensis]